MKKRQSKPARRPAQAHVVRTRTTVRGDRLATYELNEQWVTIMVRRGWRGEMLFTDAEARERATWMLRSKPGSVRLDYEYTDDQKRDWHVYLDTYGREHHICTVRRPLLGKPQTLGKAQTRLAAERRAAR
jgi:hypothetical protein